MKAQVHNHSTVLHLGATRLNQLKRDSHLFVPVSYNFHGEAIPQYSLNRSLRHISDDEVRIISLEFWFRNNILGTFKYGPLNISYII